MSKGDLWVFRSCLLFYPFLLLIGKCRVEGISFSCHVFAGEKKSKAIPFGMGNEVIFYLIKSKFYCSPSRFINVISVTRTFNYKGKDGISSLML